MSLKGWFQVAFEHELTAPVSAASVGERRLALVRTAQGVRVFDAVCPHRGANLANGGQIEGNAIRCPFHGHRVGLGDCGEHGFKVREHDSLAVGGLVFVRFSDDGDCGFRAHLEQLEREHFIIPGFTLSTSANPCLVSENAFDASHFRTVHGILNEPRLQSLEHSGGAFAVHGSFTIPRSPWQQARGGVSQLDVGYSAIAFGPWVVVSTMDGPNPYRVLTSATPTLDGRCLIRLSLIVLPDERRQPPPDELCQYLLRQSRQGLEKDRALWEGMDRSLSPQLTGGDDVVFRFQQFARGFMREERE